MVARLEVITGCMFSGKTSELMRRLERAEIAGKSVKVYKPGIDDRYGEEVIGTHNGGKRKAEIIDSEADLLEQVEPGEADVLAFDEANFFDTGIVEPVKKVSDRKRVIVAGLDQNFRAEPFNPVPELMSIAEQVDKLKAVCVECGEEATRTQRMVDGQPAKMESPSILLGADDKYEARCRECHEVR